jgi:hypothetical protein
MDLHANREQRNVLRAVCAASIVLIRRFHDARGACKRHPPAFRPDIFSDLTASRRPGALSTARSTHP